MGSNPMQSLMRCACCATAVRALVAHGACVASGLVPPPLLALLHEARVAAAREPYGWSSIPAEFEARVRRALLGAPWRAALAQYLAATPYASAHPSARIALSSCFFAPRSDYDVTDDWHRDSRELRVLVPLSRVCARTGATRLLLRSAPVSIDGLPHRRERDGFLWVVRGDAPLDDEEAAAEDGVYDNCERADRARSLRLLETSPFGNLHCDPRDVITLDADEGDVILFDASAVYHARGRADLRARAEDAARRLRMQTPV